MPITIWRPRQYATGFATKKDSYDVTPPTYYPINGKNAAAPYDHDTKVREITRYSGWTQQYYANTGEFEMTIPGDQLSGFDAVIGNMVSIGEDENYIIESVTWELNENGYDCTIGGRDMGKYLDCLLPHFPLVIGNMYTPDYGQGDKISIRGIKESFLTDFFEGSEIDEYGQTPVMNQCGWFRDLDRKYGSFITTSFADSSVENKALGSRTCKEIVSYGAALRTFCSWFGIGYRFLLGWDESKMLFTPTLDLYNRVPGGVTMFSNGKGISNFKYSKDTRNSVNRLRLSAQSFWAVSRYNTDVNYIKSDKKECDITLYLEKRDGFKNYSEFAGGQCDKFIDLGAVPDENDTSWPAAASWMKKQVETGDFVSDEEMITFDYDNNGQFVYPRHFALGSNVAILDGNIDVAAEQKLVGVKTTYSSGQPEKYSFEFGSVAVRDSDKIVAKFSELNRKTYKKRVGA